MSGSSSERFSNVSTSKSVVINEFRDEERGLFVIPSDDVDVLGMVLTAHSSTGKVVWETPARVTGPNRVWFSNADGEASGSADLVWTPDSRLGVGTASPQAPVDVSGPVRADAVELRSGAFVQTLSTSALTSDLTFALPASPGTPNQVLTTNGAGVMTWSSKGGGGQAVAGLGRVWVSDAAGAPVGDAGLTFSSSVLSVPGGISAGPLTLTSPGQDAVTLATAAGSDWTLTLPPNSGTSGQILETDGAGTTTWADPQFLSVAGLGSVWTSDGSGAPVAVAGVSVTSGGTLSAPKLDTDALDLGLTLVRASGSQGWTLTLPVNAGASGQVLQTDGAGELSWVTATPPRSVAGLGRVWVSDASGVPVGDADLTWTSDVLRVGGKVALGTGSFDVSLEPSLSTAADVTFTLPPDGGTNGQVLRTNGAGVLSWVSGSGNTVPGTGRIWVSDGAGLPVGDADFSWSAGKLRTDSVVLGGFTELVAPASSTLTFTLPADAGSSGQVLKTNGAGVLSWGASAGGSSNVPGLGQVWVSDGAGDPDSIAGLTATASELNVPGDIVLDTFTRLSGAAGSAVTFTLPPDGGTSGQILDTDGSGTMGWTDKPAPRTVSGAGRVWYSDGSGAPLGDSGFTFSSGTLAAPKVLLDGDVTVQPSAASAGWALTLPPDAGTAGTFLRTDGAGVSTWAAPVLRSVAGAGSVWVSDSGGAPVAVPSFSIAGTSLSLPGSVGLPGSSAGKVTVAAPASGTTWSLTLPTAGGDSGQFLQTNGSGVTSWAPVPLTAAGLETQVMYNSGGLLQGSAGLTFAAGALSVSTSVSTATANATTVNTDDLVLVTDSGSLTFKGSAATSSDVELTFPPTAGSNGQVLTTDGSGGLAWSTVSGGGGGGSPGGNAGAVQFSDGTTFAGDAALNFDAASDTLTLTNGTNDATLAADVLAVGSAFSVSNGGAVTAPSLILDAGSGSLTFLGSGALDLTLYFPGTAGTSGQVLATDGAGDLSWTSLPETYPSSGVDGLVQVGDGSSGFKTVAGFTATSTALGVPGSAVFPGSTSGQVTVAAPAAGASWTLTLPPADGDSGQFLRTDGSGATSWAPVPASVAYGAAGQVPVSDGSGFTYSAGLTFSGGELSSATVDATTSLTVNGLTLTSGGTYALEFPADEGTSGQVLATDGVGELSWTSLPATYPADGVAGLVQLSGGSGTFSSDAGLSFAGTTLTVPGKIAGVVAPTADTDAANKKYVDDGIAGKVVYPAIGVANLIQISVGDGTFKSDAGLSFAGTTLTVPGLISGVATPAAAGDAANKQYVDDEVKVSSGAAGLVQLSGGSGTFSSDAGLSFAGTVLTVPGKIEGVAAPAADTDAANKKYVDDEVAAITTYPSSVTAGTVQLSAAGGAFAENAAFNVDGTELNVPFDIVVSSGTSAVTLKAPPGDGFFSDFQFPATAPTTGQVLKSQGGSGQTYWADVAVVTQAAGQVLYSDGSGGVSGDATFTLAGSVLSVAQVNAGSGKLVFDGTDLVSTVPVSVKSGAGDNYLEADSLRVGDGDPFTVSSAGAVVAASAAVAGVVSGGGVRVVNGAKSTQLGVSASQVADAITYTLPLDLPSSTQFLSSTTAGAMAWAEVSQAAGAAGLLQFSGGSGTFSSDAGLSFSGTTLTVPGLISGVATPAAAGDAANKSYVDTAAAAAAAGVETYPADGVANLIQISVGDGTFKSDAGLSFSGTVLTVPGKIAGVADPTADQDAATKKYVDDGIAGKATYPAIGGEGVIQLASGSEGTFDSNANLNLAGTILTVPGRITGVAAPTANLDAANKAYVDGAVENSDGASGRVQISDGSGGFTSSSTITFSSNTLVVGNAGDTAIIRGDVFQNHNSSFSVTNAGACTAVSFTTSSDIRIKRNIARIDPAEAGRMVDQVAGYAYNLVDREDKKTFGVIAQEVEAVPGLADVVTDGPEYKSVDYTQLIPLLLETVRDLRARVAELEAA